MVVGYMKKVIMAIYAWLKGLYLKFVTDKLVEEVKQLKKELEDVEKKSDESVANANDAAEQFLSSLSETRPSERSLSEQVERVRGSSKEAAKSTKGSTGHERQEDGSDREAGRGYLGSEEGAEASKGGEQEGNDPVDSN
jgi:ElaB/YqjD/DUF883 family membrane-anchored ribosome-binding protein